MHAKMIDPYATSPVYGTKRFWVRLVRMEDAVDLLDCYSDPIAIPLFNSDNCRSDFNMSTVKEMEDIIRSWLKEYQERGYVRFSIVDKISGRAAGTIEFFSRGGLDGDKRRAGILRLDLSSTYEREDNLDELIEMVEEHFRECFEFTSILTKAAPMAKQRISVLLNRGYHKMDNSMIMPYDDYYIKNLPEV